MTNLKKFLALLASIAVISFLVSSPSAHADTVLTVGGVTLTVPGTIYEPSGMGNTNVNVGYVNNSGVQLLEVGYTVTDLYGTQLAEGYVIGLPVGARGSISSSWSSSYFSNAVRPYKINLKVTHYSGTGKGDELTSAPLVLLQKPGSTNNNSAPTPTPTVTVTAQPTPAPTVTVTAQPSGNIATLNALIQSLTAQNSLLNSKLKKICASKPKPKGC